jgi:protein O-GlcNAc transferase
MTYKVWMDILKDVPDSVLWILEYPADAKQNLQKEAEKNGVDP